MRKIIFYLSLIIIVGIMAFVDKDIDFDLWARLAVGSLFFQTGWILKKDIFAFTPTKDIWIDHEWGAGVIFYSIVRIFGEWGLIVFKAVILFIIFILVSRIIKLQLDKFANIEIWPFIIMGFALYISIASQVRAQIFTFLFFTLWLFILEKAKRNDNKLIWIFPVTMLLWVNMHGGFLSGIGLLVIYGIGEFLNGKKTLKYLAILGSTFPATLINPYGIEFWKYILKASTMPRPGVIEWQSIDFLKPCYNLWGIHLHVYFGFFILLFLTLLAVLMALIKKKKPDWIKILLIGITIYYSIKYQRLIPFFAISASTLLYVQYMDLFLPLRDFITDKLGNAGYKTALTIKYILTYSIIACSFMLIFPLSKIGLTINPYLYPVGSFEFIKQNNLSGNLATTYNWGSYAFWKFYPECKVMIDGRYEEVYTDDVYSVSTDFSDHRTAHWNEFLRLYTVDIIVAPKNGYTPSDFWQLSGWRIVYEDFVSIVLLPINKVKDTYILPDFNNKVYRHEDLSRPIQLGK